MDICVFDLRQFVKKEAPDQVCRCFKVAAVLHFSEVERILAANERTGRCWSQT
jgi:hypothetical protein